MSPKQVAIRLGVSQRTTYRLISDGDLIATRIRGQWRVSEEALTVYLSKNTTALKAAKNTNGPARCANTGTGPGLTLIRKKESSP